MTADSKAEYAVGYKKPPLHTRFKKGNPGGRPRAARPEPRCSRIFPPKREFSGCGGRPRLGEVFVNPGTGARPVLAQDRIGSTVRTGRRGSTGGAASGRHELVNHHGSSDMIGIMPLHAPTPLHPGEGTHLVVILAGPTASGKSALALALAENLGGVVINADSLQCYRDLRILTARPDPAAEALAPHRLYGFLDAADPGSAGRWRASAMAEIAAATAAGRLPIVVGGTGLYLRALTLGLAPIPEIPDEVRQEARALFRAVGGSAFRQRLERLDRAAAERLAPGDAQRLLRAYEVVRATGRPIGWWCRQPHGAPAGRFATILLMPPRAALYAGVNARFTAMIDTGGLDEAAALLSRRLDPGLPAMKAAGLPQLFAHLQGAIGLDEAIAAGQRATRRYAKRQMTWFRHQSHPDLIFAEQFSERIVPVVRQFINDTLLTGRA